MDIYKYSEIIKNKGYEQDLIFIKYNKYLNLNEYEKNKIGTLVGIHINGISYRLGWNYKKNDITVGYLSIFKIEIDKTKKKLYLELKEVYKNIILKKKYEILIKIGYLEDIGKIIISFL
jgi:hypothetical protein